jgi:hypothetical protein
METSDPQIYLYVTKHYSASDMPGFFSIPFNFGPEIVENYENLKDDVINNRIALD